jgi:hypothetical protein
MKLIIAFHNFAKAPKNQPVNAAQGNTQFVLRTKQNTYMYSAGRTYYLVILNTLPQGKQPKNKIKIK